MAYIRVKNDSKVSSGSNITTTHSTTKSIPKVPPANAPTAKQPTTTSSSVPSTTTPPVPAPQKTVTPSPPSSPPAPAPNVTHPTIANCTRQNFNVYASVPSGTHAYNGNGYTNVMYTWPYGSEITNVYCDSADSEQMVFRIDNPGTPNTQYSAYHWADVSLTKP
ncbi:MAG TPA: hypothetical protein VGS08_04070 [Candidatus Saccharimonadales bacterium]|nr:hypothetical protein [Candidatus Saccharimonadales bacterium]